MASVTSACAWQHRGSLCQFLGHFCPGASLSPEECQEGGEIWNPSLLRLNGFLPTTLPRSHSCPSLLQRKGRKGQQTPESLYALLLATRLTATSLQLRSEKSARSSRVERLKACKPKCGRIQQGQTFRVALCIMHIQPAEEELRMFNGSVSALRLPFVLRPPVRKRQIWRQASH